MREIVCRNNGRFSLEGNGEEVSTKVILNLKSLLLFLFQKDEVVSETRFQKYLFLESLLTVKL